MSDGLVARLVAPLERRADFGALLSGDWTAASAGDLARRSVELDGANSIPFGDLCRLSGEPAGKLRLEGDFSRAERVGAGMTAGEVIVEGSVGAEAGAGMSGGSLEVRGNAGPRAGGAGLAARRGMSGGELIIHGTTGPDAGCRMRRGLLVIGRDAAGHVGFSAIAGSVVVCGDAGPNPGVWMKRASLVALGPVQVPVTYRYACTYQPVHLRLTFARLRTRYRLPIEDHHLTGYYRRYSGDLAELGRGEILAWSAE